MPPDTTPSNNPTSDIQPADKSSEQAGGQPAAVTVLPNVSPAQAVTPSPTPPASSPLPTGADSVVTDVNSSLWDYIKKRKMPTVILSVIGTIIWEIGAFALATSPQVEVPAQTGQSSQNVGWIFIVPFILLAGWIAWLRAQFEQAMLEEFARANGYDFEVFGAVDETYGSVFKINGRQQVSDIVTGKYRDCEMRLFLYTVTVGSGSYSHTYSYTVMELDLKGKMPHLLLSNKKLWFEQSDQADSVKTAFNGEDPTTVSLEGDFNDFFTLHVERGEETEALEIFTPDVMQLMEDNSKHFSVEVVDSLVYIYYGKIVRSGAQLATLFALAEKMIAKLDPVAERMDHDAAVAANTAPVPRASVDLDSGTLHAQFGWKRIRTIVVIWLLGALLAALLLLVLTYTAGVGK